VLTETVPIELVEALELELHLDITTLLEVEATGAQAQELADTEVVQLLQGLLECLHQEHLTTAGQEPALEEATTVLEEAVLHAVATTALAEVALEAALEVLEAALEVVAATEVLEAALEVVVATEVLEAVQDQVAAEAEEEDNSHISIFLKKTRCKDTRHSIELNFNFKASLGAMQPFGATNKINR